MSAALQAGADALLQLVVGIGKISNAAFETSEGVEDSPDDVRDYPAIVAALEVSLRANLAHPELQHREGYLRALGALLTLFADGCTVDIPGPWCPLVETAPAYARLQEGGASAGA